MMKERQIQQITWDKPGTVIEGVLQNVRRVKYSDGVGVRYVVRSNEGKIFSFRGGAMLDMCLSHHDLGKLIRVEYVGLDSKEPKAGFSATKVFRVLVDEDSDYGKPDDTPITDDDIPF